MSRTLINFWLDVALLLLFLTVLWFAFVIRFVFPPATVADGWQLWGWSYDQWADGQFALNCIFGLAVLLHVMLHWTWVCGVLAKNLSRPREGSKMRIWDDGTRTIVGVGVLIVVFNVLGVAFAAAALTVQSPG